jgi:two-component system chemotaxis sensor kinase CheA
MEDLELIEEFVIESQEHLGDIETDFLTLELQGEEVDVDLVNKVFRAIHSIKGAAGFMGLNVLEKLAHREEEVLNRIRNRELVPSVAVVGTLLKATDTLKLLLDSIATSNDMDVSRQIAELDQILSSTKPEIKVPDAAASSEASLEQVEQGVQALDQNTDDSNTTHVEDSDPTNSPATLTAAADIEPQPDEAKPSAPAISEPDPAASAPSASATSAPTPSGDRSSPDASIRVDVRLLDTLMNQVGELVLARNQMLQFAERFDDNEYSHTSQRLNLITSELQEGVMKTRMQPIGNVWSKFPRLVRDLSHICEKEVRIEMVGKETELDKTIIEAIKDPLTHLVRNTVDHGIETPEAREANGKSREGCLMLRAFHEGGQVNIEISDDGGGLNLERIKENAVFQSY